MFLSFLLHIGAGLNAQSEPAKSELDSIKVKELHDCIKKSTHYAVLKLFDSAQIYTKRADIIAKEIKDVNLSGLVNYNNAKINYWYANPSRAKDILQDNLDATQLHDSIQLKTHVIYSEISQYERNFKSALEHLISAEGVVLGDDDLTLRDSLSLGLIYLKIGRLHYNFENLNNAKQYYEKALLYCSDSNYKTTILHYLSELYNAEEQLENAIAYSLRSLEFAKKKEQKVFLPTNYATIGEYYLKDKKADSAIYYARMGLKNNEDCQLDWLSHIVGGGYKLKGNHQEALRHLNLALSQTTNEDRTLAILKDLKDTYTKLRDYKNAITHGDAYLKLKNTIDERKVRQEILEITERYESDKKELEIEMLNAENEHSSFVIQKQNLQLWLVSLSLVLLLLILGLILYYYQRQKRQRQILYAKNVQLAGRLKENMERSNPIKNGVKVKNTASTLDKTTTNAIKGAISDLISTEFYLDPDLTLSKMAKEIDTNTSYLSKVINEHYEISFTNFINELRISYTLKSLETVPEFSKYTVDHIAEKSGFASSSAFYKAFKKYTGLTPSYYIKKRLEQQTITT
ncbi:MAG: helix-turn-helix domain-containing protein [Bacteroidota bacterium]